MQNWPGKSRARHRPLAKSGRVKHIVGSTRTIRFKDALTQAVEREFETEIIDFEKQGFVRLDEHRD